MKVTLRDRFFKLVNKNKVEKKFMTKQLKEVWNPEWHNTNGEYYSNFQDILLFHWSFMRNIVRPLVPKRILKHKGYGSYEFTKRGYKIAKQHGK